MDGDPLDILFQLFGLVISEEQYQMAKKQFNVQKIQTILSDALQSLGYNNQLNSYTGQNIQLNNSELSDASQLLSAMEGIPEQEIQKVYNLYSYNMNNANQYRQDVSDSTYDNAMLNNLRRGNDSAIATNQDSDKINKYYQTFVKNTLARNKLVRNMIKNDQAVKKLNTKSIENVKKAEKLITKGTKAEEKAFNGGKTTKATRIIHPYF